MRVSTRIEWGAASLLVVLVAIAGCKSARLGAAGESCQARNDCGPELACMRNVCIPTGGSFTVTGKSCYRVECEADADCCASFTPSVDCDFYRARCDADPLDCAAFNAFCVCSRACEAALCISNGPRCTMDAECPSFSAPYCVADQCVECREHADCPAEGDRCVASRCERGCTTDDECPPLYACEASTCTPSGCVTDRECAFLLDDPRAQCNMGGCEIACTDDLECDTSGFEVCSDGRCEFIGCETDTDCRAFFGEGGLASGARALCR